MLDKGVSGSHDFYDLDSYSLHSFSNELQISNFHIWLECGGAAPPALPGRSDDY